MSKLLTVEEFAAEVGWKPATVRQKVWRREIEFVRVGRCIRFRTRNRRKTHPCWYCARAGEAVMKVLAQRTAELPTSTAHAERWPEPEPLADALPDVAQFDLELMPESFRPLVKDVAERMQVPPDFPAVAAIAALAGVTNRRAMIQPKRNDDTWTVVPNLWGGIVAPPGMLKSPVLSCMTQPARAIESEWRKAHEDEEQVYQTALELQEVERKGMARRNTKRWRRRTRNGPQSRNPHCTARASPPYHQRCNL